MSTLDSGCHLGAMLHALPASLPTALRAPPCPLHAAQMQSYSPTCCLQRTAGDITPGRQGPPLVMQATRTEPLNPRASLRSSLTPVTRSCQGTWGRGCARALPFRPSLQDQRRPDSGQPPGTALALSATRGSSREGLQQGTLLFGHSPWHHGLRGPAATQGAPLG